MEREQINTDALTWQLNLSSVLEVVSFSSDDSFLFLFRH